MNSLYDQKTINTYDLFDSHTLDGKTLYMHLYNSIPDSAYIGGVDAEKASALIKEKFADRILNTHIYTHYESKKKSYDFNTDTYVLDKCVIHLSFGYCMFFYDPSRKDLVDEVTKQVAPIRQKQKRDPFEINMVVRGHSGLELKPIEIKKTKLDLDLYYPEDFKPVDALIRERLCKNNDKGIVLLHGLPGSGKTTYLRYLIGKIKKRVLFLSPSVADHLMDPDFVDMLIRNPNTVVIIEDAENIIMDRKMSPSSSVSNLLNISDGLLADFLNVQLICTFNNSLTMVDNALLRKGRLIARYEFNKLSVAQSQRLSTHLGFDTLVTKPMTVAEIANQHEKPQEGPKMEAIGFRTQSLSN